MKRLRRISRYLLLAMMVIAPLASSRGGPNYTASPEFTVSGSNVSGNGNNTNNAFFYSTSGSYQVTISSGAVLGNVTTSSGSYSGHYVVNIVNGTAVNNGTIQSLGSPTQTIYGLVAFSVSTQDANVALTNHGIVNLSGSQVIGMGIASLGGSASGTVYNSGTIQTTSSSSTGLSEGVLLQCNSTSASSNTSLVNYGTITATGFLLNQSEDAEGVAVIVGAGSGSTTLTNYGSIYGFGPFADGINGFPGNTLPLIINNYGTVYGTCSGIYSGGYTVVNLDGGSVTGSSSYAVEINSGVISVNGRSLLSSGTPQELKSLSTGSLNFNLIGGTREQIALAQAAIATANGSVSKTGSFQFGGSTYSWTNFQVGQQSFVSLATVSARQYGDLAEKIDGANSYTTLPGGYGVFYSEALNDPNGALNQLSGYTLIQGAHDLEVQSQNTLLSNLETQLESLQGSGGLNTASATIGDSSIASVNDANSKLERLVAFAGSQTNGTDSKVLVPPTTQAERWDVWLAGNVTLGHENARSGGASYDSVNGAPMIGFDYAFLPDLKVGLLAAGTLDGANFSDGSRVDANAELFGTYATYCTGPWLANGVFAGGPSQYSDHRSTFGNTATSHPDGYSLLTQGTVGYAFNLTNNITATPEIGFQYAHVNIGSYTEEGAGIFNTHVADQDIDSLRTHLGSKLKATLKVGPNLTLIPEVQAAWYHECLDGSQGIATSLTGAPNFGSFNITTQENDRDYALLGLGLNSVFTGYTNVPIAMFLNYDVQVGQSQYIEHSITGGIRVSF